MATPVSTQVSTRTVRGWHKVRRYLLLALLVSPLALAPVLLARRDTVPAMGNGVGNVSGSPAEAIGTLDDLSTFTWETYASNPLAYSHASQPELPASAAASLAAIADHEVAQDWSLDRHTGSASIDPPLLTSLAATSTPDFTMASVARLAMSLPAGSGSYASAGGVAGGSPGSGNIPSETGSTGGTPANEELTKRGSAPQLPPDTTDTDSSDNSQPDGNQPGAGPGEGPVNPDVQYPQVQYPQADAPVSVPEPGTGALLLCALASYWACGRRKV